MMIKTVISVGFLSKYNITISLPAVLLLLFALKMEACLLNVRYR